MNDLLAICTQTFNSGPCLTDYLNNLIPQARTFEIPIHVFVTRSTDNTLQVLKDFRKEYQYLFYEYSEKNYGHDKSLISATKLARTRYIWPIGVRRRLTPFAIEKVHNALQKFEPDLLILNTVERNSTAGKEAVECYNNLQELFLKFYPHLGMLGTIVLPKEAWRLPALDKYLENEKLSAWIHLPTTFEYLASLQNFRALYLASPLITSTGTFPSTWNKRTFEIYEMWANIVETLPKISDENKRLIIARQYRSAYQPMNLAFFRSLGAYDGATYKKYRQALDQSTNPTISRIIAKFPIFPLAVAYKVYNFTRRIMRMFIHSYYPINPLNDGSSPN